MRLVAFEQLNSQITVLPVTLLPDSLQHLWLNIVIITEIFLLFLLRQKSNTELFIYNLCNSTRDVWQTAGWNTTLPMSFSWSLCLMCWDRRWSPSAAGWGCSYPGNHTAWKRPPVSQWDKFTSFLCVSGSFLTEPVKTGHIRLYFDFIKAWVHTKLSSCPDSDQSPSMEYVDCNISRFDLTHHHSYWWSHISLTHWTFFLLSYSFSQ